MAIKVVAVIPCHNEEEHIAGIVGALCNTGIRVIVVDDHSSDKTATVARRAGAVVLPSIVRGAGAATAQGIQTALLLSPDVVVTLDGDGQHDPEEVWKLITPVTDGSCDVAVGSRFLTKNNIPLFRKVGVKVINWLFNVGSDRKLSDTQCCYRAFSPSALKVTAITSRGFSFSVETLARARAHHLRILEVPVTVTYHGRSDHTANPVLHGVVVALSVIKWRIKKEKK